MTSIHDNRFKVVWYLGLLHGIICSCKCLDSEFVGLKNLVHLYDSLLGMSKCLRSLVRKYFPEPCVIDCSDSDNTPF